MSKPAVFFVPHQDDEFLTQGPLIHQHIEAGRDVYVIMMSDGQSSGVRSLLEKEGYPLSQSAFSKARDREALDCLNRLGVPVENIYFENLEDGGSYTLTKVKNIMRSYITIFGEASYKTHSWMDKHRDHFVLGRALDELNNANIVPSGDARFSKSFRYDNAPTPGGGYQYSTDSALLLNAARAYDVWAPNRKANASNPSSGPRYAIGYRSVGKDWFETVAAERGTFVHVGSYNYTAAGRNNANRWLSANGQNPYL